MAAEKKPETTTPEPTKKRKLPIKTVGMVVGLMVVEGAVLVAVMGMVSPSKGEAAETTHELASNEAEQTQELMIAEEKFQNLQTGRVWIWDTSVYVQVRSKNLEHVEQTLERRNAEIKEGLSQIVSRAQHAQLKEPDRQTLNRQITTFLESVFATDGEGKPLIERVLIPNCRGFPADF
jgi:flagellar basal body-associated protein FliL